MVTAKSIFIHLTQPTNYYSSSSISVFKSKENTRACLISSIAYGGKSPNLRSSLTLGTEPIPCTLATEPCVKKRTDGNSTS